MVYESLLTLSSPLSFRVKFEILIYNLEKSEIFSWRQCFISFVLNYTENIFIYFTKYSFEIFIIFLSFNISFLRNKKLSTFE